MKWKPNRIDAFLCGDADHIFTFFKAWSWSMVELTELEAMKLRDKMFLLFPESKEGKPPYNILVGRWNKKYNYFSEIVR